MGKNEIKPIDESGDNPQYHVCPEDINMEMTCTFGKAEIESSARVIVQFCQSRGGWYAFELLELIKYCKQINFNPNMIFFGIIGHWFDDCVMGGGICGSHPSLVLWGYGKYCVTESFILRCAKRTR